MAMELPAGIIELSTAAETRARSDSGLKEWVRGSHKELLFHHQTVGDNCFCATRPHELGDGGQLTGEEYQQAFHGGAG
jgi:hypothetical protein